jgi:1-acyl-sn-glycerol-3-phosphate acyltransferase
LTRRALPQLPTAARVVRRSLTSVRRATTFPVRPATVPNGVEVPRRPARTGTAFDTAWARSAPARVVRWTIIEGVARPVVAALAMPRRQGADRLLGMRGAMVFVANHHSHLDTPLLLTSIPEPWRHRLVVGAASDYFFDRRLTAAASALAIGAVPVERTRASRKSATQLLDLLEEGWSVLLYPEGGRSPDGWGQEFRKGAAWLAVKAGVPAVPIHVAGTGRILRKGRVLPSPAPTRVTIGEPLRPTAGESADALNERLSRAVDALADEARTDWWQARHRAHADASPHLVGPGSGAWRRAWALPTARSASTPAWPRR